MPEGDPAEPCYQILLGGLLRGSSFGTVGPLTTGALKTLRADIAFLSPDRLDPDGPVFNSLMDAEVWRLMGQRAARTVIIADSSKLAGGGTALLTPWEEVDDLVTDAVHPDFCRTLREASVAVTIADRLTGPSRS